MLGAIGGALGIGGADLLGAGLGYISQDKTNQMNRDIAREQMAFEGEQAGLQRDWSSDQAIRQRQWSSAQAARQMQFQRDMSSTAVQRRMADMRKAGINPLLAGKYDASTPAGAIGTGGIPSGTKANAKGYTATSPLEGIFNRIGTALSLKKLSADIKSVEATTDLTARKKDLTDPVNRVMDILDNVLQGATNTPKAYKQQAKDLKQELQSLLKSVGEGYAKNQGYHVPGKQPLTKQTKMKYPLKGVADKDRKPFNFAR